MNFHRNIRNKRPPAPLSGSTPFAAPLGAKDALATTEYTQYGIYGTGHKETILGTFKIIRMSVRVNKVGLKISTFLLCPLSTILCVLVHAQRRL